MGLGGWGRGGKGKGEGGWEGWVYLVAETLGGDDGDFIADAFVGLEVEGELGVVAFDDYFGRLLDGLGVHVLISMKNWIEHGWSHDGM